MLQVNITDDIIQTAFDKMLEQTLKPDNYNNPMKSIVEKLIGTSYSKGSMWDEIEKSVSAKLRAFMKTDVFDKLLGQAVAAAIAAREIAKDKR